MKSATAWYVITGGPSSGITTLIQALKERDFNIQHESARIIIDEEIAAGKEIADIRGNEAQFQEIVYYHKLEREAQLDPESVIFFDRGLPDTFAYNKLHNFPISKEMDTVMRNVIYKKVFLLEPFTYEKDYARVESEEECERLFHLLQEAYQRSNTPMEIIPAFPTKEERIQYFFNYLEREEGITISR